MKKLVVLAITCVLSLLPAVSQTASAPVRVSDSAETIKLLHEVADHYRAAKSFLIERVREDTASGRDIKSWNRMFQVMARAPGGKSRYELRSQYGSTLVVSNGSSEWQVDPDANQYVKRPAKLTPDRPLPGELGFMGWLMQIDDKLANGRLLAPEVVEVAGKKVECVKIIGPSARQSSSDPTRTESTYWVDPKGKILVKESAHTVSVQPFNDFVGDGVTTYMKTELDTALPHSMFTYVPPKDAIEVPSLGPAPVVDLLGKPAPALSGTTLEGKKLTLESLKGKIVLVDFWATSCGACIASLPYVARIYNDYSSKGVFVLGVDQDSDPANAKAFVTKGKYNWPHISDPDGSTNESWGSGIPRLVVIDQKGIVSYVAQGFEESDEVAIRAQLEKLKPSFTAP